VSDDNQTETLEISLQCLRGNHFSQRHYFISNFEESLCKRSRCMYIYIFFETDLRKGVEIIVQVEVGVTFR
jgi:hypothetical protein